MSKIKLQVLGISYSQTQTGAYALVLTEEHGDRRIPIIIGGFEAQAIAIQLEGLKPPRPLTHDLFKNLAFAFDINVSEVIIYKLEEGIFFSELLCEMGNEEIRIDSRTSDAVALALRFKCPIYTNEDILEKAGIVMENDSEGPVEFEDSGSETGSKNEFENYSATELNEMLGESINNENYERASRIRDELKRRKK